MSFEIDLKRRVGERLLSVRFASEGGLTALFGPSGVGKTSLLNMVAGLLKPDEGRIMVDGAVLFDSAAHINLPPEHRRIGYVFQEPRLFPHMRVDANLLYGARLAPPGERWMKLDDAVGFLGIAPLLRRYPATLSGGEAQRVAIGRALLAAPRILLMDEPLASLDKARREEILIVVERIRDELKRPILYVSHDRAEVDRLAGRVVELNGD